MSVLQCVRNLPLGRRTVLSRGSCSSLFGGQDRSQAAVLGAGNWRCYSQETGGASTKVPSSAKVVVCGGGVVGTSVAYHLAKAGWTDVVLLEQGQ
jgi:NADPH-dependent 2,4-dienoyl-CoA reductase/sulfur reductase-like enzyme